MISRVQSLAKVWGQCRVWTCSQGLNRWHCAVPQVRWQRLAGGLLAGGRRWWCLVQMHGGLSLSFKL